jgi:hypothetical protein
VKKKRILNLSADAVIDNMPQYKIKQDISAQKQNAAVVTKAEYSIH